VELIELDGVGHQVPSRSCRYRPLVVTTSPS
jgi:hypothetical protein